MALDQFSLAEVWRRLTCQPDGQRTFAAVLDVYVNLLLLYADICDIGSMWNRLFSKGRHEGGSVLENEEKFSGKMDIHRHATAPIYRIRALWDKAMALVVLYAAPEQYSVFDKAKSKKRAFRKIMSQYPEFAPDSLGSFLGLLEHFDNELRTPEVHGTGSLRKWSFSMGSIESGPIAEIIVHWNLLNIAAQSIGTLLALGSGSAIPPAKDIQPQ